MVCLQKEQSFSLVNALRLSLGVLALASELGIECDNPIQVNLDASASIGISNRVGSGSSRQIEVSQAWSQEKVRNNTIVVNTLVQGRHGRQSVRRTYERG